MLPFDDVMCFGETDSGVFRRSCIEDSARYCVISTGLRGSFQFKNIVFLIFTIGNPTPANVTSRFKLDCQCFTFVARLTGIKKSIFGRSNTPC